MAHPIFFDVLPKVAIHPDEEEDDLFGHGESVPIQAGRISRPLLKRKANLRVRA